MPFLLTFAFLMPASLTSQARVVAPYNPIGSLKNVPVPVRRRKCRLNTSLTRRPPSSSVSAQVLSALTWRSG
ncbi:MAG TPA: hypothetical protein VF797_08890 [Noviherbaspirillum sp.]